MLAAPILFFLLAPSLAVVAFARYAAAMALGMRGIGLAFGGRIADPAAAAPWRRALVVLAALAASYGVPALALTAAALVQGELSTEVSVLPGKPAEAAGLENGDRVISIGGEPVATWEALKAGVSRHAGEPVELVVSRAGAEKRFTVTPQGPPGHGRIGLETLGRYQPAGLVNALGAGLTGPVKVLAAAGTSVASMLRGSTDVELAGPVGIVRATAGAAGSGAGSLLALLAAMIAYVWPIAAIVAVIAVPRKAKKG
jgi:regulator of sigma E protease